MISIWLVAGYSVLCVAAMLVLALGLTLGRRNPVFLTRGYPPALKAAYRPMTPDEKKYAALWAVPVMAFILFAPLGYLIWAEAALQRDFLGLWLDGFCLLWAFNLVDLVIIDWLVFCWWTPKFIVLPGTEGHAGYKDYGFHFHGFLKGTVLVAVLAAAFAGLVWGIARLL